eukprot:gene11471-4635_t
MEKLKNIATISTNIDIIARDQEGNVKKCDFDKNAISRSLVDKIKALPLNTEIGNIAYDFHFNKTEKVKDDYIDNETDDETCDNGDETEVETEEDESGDENEEVSYDIVVDHGEYIDLLKENSSKKSYYIKQLENIISEQD